MLEKIIKKICKQYYPRSILVISHVNADPDALASSFLSVLIFDKICNCRTYQVFPEGISSLSKRILERLSLKTKENKEDYSYYDFYVVVDAVNSIQLGDLSRVVKENFDRLLLIDHHSTKGDLLENASYSYVKNEVATTVLIGDALMRLNITPSRELCTLALAGILFDSKKFAIATPTALKVASFFLEKGGNYSLAQKLLEEKRDISEKIARLKGIQRAHIIRIGKYIVAITEVSAYEASVARLLISAGADIAIVVGGKKSLRISMRVAPSLIEENVTAERIMKKLALKIGGYGGGHAAAAGFNLPEESSTRLRQKVVKEILNILSLELFRQ